MKKVRLFLLMLLVSTVLLALPCEARRLGDPVVEHVLEEWSRETAEGVTLGYQYFLAWDGVAREIYTIEIDMTRNTLALATPGNGADNDGGNGLGAPLVDMANDAAQAGKTVVAAVNGDFYKTPTDGAETLSLFASLGVMVKDGQLLSDGARQPGAMYFGVTQSGKAVMGSAEEGSDWDEIKDSLYTAIGGELWLIRDGESNLVNIRWDSESGTLLRRYGAAGRIADDDGAVLTDDISSHPRSCVGIRADGSVVILCAAIGSSDPGLTIEEMTGLMLQRGCVQLMNLDGGPSTQLAVDEGSGLSLIREDGVSPRLGEGLLVVKGLPKLQQESFLERVGFRMGTRDDIMYILAGVACASVLIVFYERWKKKNKNKRR